jgi:CubicO group peptidase (beta-lactamase class C family)
MLAYHEAHFPYDSASEDVAGIHRELQLNQWTGGFELKRGEESTPTRFVATLNERDSDQFAHAAMDVDAAAPHPVVKFEIHPIATPEDLYPARLIEEATLGALRVEIDTALRRDRFSGVVLIAKHGTPVFAEAFGLADRAAHLPNRLHTRFRLASMNKMFTGTAVLRLVQDGRLALTDTIGDILADYSNREVASKVTIHHL